MSVPKLNPEERDRRVLDLYEQLLEIEQRLIPTGLHVFGRPSQAQEKADLLRLIASFDRTESGARAVTDLVGETGERTVSERRTNEPRDKQDRHDADDAAADAVDDARRLPGDPAS